MGEPTGSISVQPGAAIAGAEPIASAPQGTHECTGCRYEEKIDKGPLGLTRDTWAKLIIWFIPMVFFAGGTFVSMRNLTEKVGDHGDAIENVRSAQTDVEKTQVQHEATISAIQETQKELKGSVKAIDNKLDNHGKILSAMEVRFKLDTGRAGGSVE